MILFLRNIPATTRPNELRDYVALALGEDLNDGTGRVLKAEVMVIRDKRTNQLEHHGLVQVDSDEAGIRAIKNLNGLLFNNCEVLVRRYKDRDAENDRRHDGGAVLQEIIDKRVQDRRRGDSVDIYIDFSNQFYFLDI